ncbi:MAG TPA: glycoside hydrolase family 2 TIM barrel-domain containing protein [Candidatus Atribacteria bacterium]|nr:glycoside hydrolase family 2 TIM barrel-domain containing protein [Candidatus Atribacteria bacterium]
MLRKKLFNDNWHFSKQKLHTGLEGVSKPDTVWIPVDLPHDWLIYDTENLYEDSEGWYKKSFTVDRLDRVYSIRFEGVYMDSTVYVNDKVAGEWKYGYSTFEFDITGLLRAGDNEIKVRVVYQSPNTRWYSGAGIYRNVYLLVRDPVHLVSDGIYISTEKLDGSWRVLVDTEAVNKGEGSVEALIRHTVLDMEGNAVAISVNKAVLGTSLHIDQQALTVESPRLWDHEDPYLYTLKTELVKDGRTVDEESCKFGFRTLHFDTDKGFFINGKYLKLHGVCQHHDLGALGAAVNKVALRRQFEILREMGVNAIRTSHNMPAVEFMELADEMGMLVVSEAFDMWERPKTTYDYARFFNDWCEKDVASWIRRDRNHPSVIMWSIGNEIYDTHADERGLEITRMLKGLVRKHDPRRNSVVTIGSNYMFGENAQKCADELDAAGYNYGEYLYEEHHKKYPHWVIYGSETSSTLQSRGIYHFPASYNVLTHEDLQCSSLDNCTTNWGAKSTQKVIIDDRDAEFCLGQFIWTGFDYIGEPTPYTTKNSYFGQIDTAGFKKDSFYLYQAEWTDYRKNPMVHILPYWDFNEGQLIDVKIYSNAPKVELFFNDESMGVYEIDHKKGKQLCGHWQIPYRKGTIRAVAYDEAGNVIATDAQTSFGNAARIVLKADKKQMKADGLDLIFVEISTVDKDGNPVRNANNRVNVEVTGAGRLVGLDNGDSTDFDQYKGTSRRLFSGKLLAIIASKLEAGDIKVRVTSRGLTGAELDLTAVPADPVPGVSALMENTRSEPNDEIPVRKIELTNHGASHFDGCTVSTRVTARIYPENATYRDLIWKVVTLSGIETNVAKVEAKGDEAVVTALGDGAFKLRCICKNGTDHSDIVSELDFEATGMGEATLNPYEFVPAALYNAGNNEFQNSLQGGICTFGDRQNLIGFRKVDFGEIGSDEITIPIFTHSSDPLPIEIWENMPGEPGAELLAKVFYQAESQWNVYQARTFRLPRRLKGLTTLCIVIDHMKLYLQGFVFKKYEKAYETLPARSAGRIYGDAYKVGEEAVENIGNNVVLEFEDMDFGDRGFSRIVICGRSHTEKNTINILFSGEGGDIKQAVEFDHSEDYVEREFTLNSVTGRQKVSFVFLPGSSFDFKWFRFE